MVKKSVFSIISGKSSKASKENDSDSVFKFNKERDRWYKELVERLVQRDKDFESSKQEALKLVEKQNALESKLRGKNQEIAKLNDKILILTQELATVKGDYMQALEEIKTLKLKAHDTARRDEIIKQKKELHSRMQKELIKSNQLLVQEKLKRHSLENPKLNPHRWRTMEYTDPHYVEILQRKNYLQKELKKKMDLLSSKDNQLRQQNKLLNSLTSMLKRRPFLYTEKPEEQMIEYYRTIQNQKEKIRIMASQINMYESLISNQYNKILNTKKSINIDSSELKKKKILIN